MRPSSIGHRDQRHLTRHALVMVAASLAQCASPSSAPPDAQSPAAVSGSSLPPGETSGISGAVLAGPGATLADASRMAEAICARHGLAASLGASGRQGPNLMLQYSCVARPE
jgi:hypothetical protein